MKFNIKKFAFVRLKSNLNTRLMISMMLFTNIVIFAQTPTTTTQTTPPTTPQATQTPAPHNPTSTSSVPSNLTLEQVISSVNNRTNVVNAKIELSNAQAELARAQSDPLITRIPLLQAQQHHDKAAAKYKHAFYSALTEVASAYTNLLNARAGLQIANTALGLQEQAAKVAEIRFANGSITEIEKQEANTSLEGARTLLTNSQNSLNVAKNNLESILGYGIEVSTLAPLAESQLKPVPPVEQALQTSRNHPSLVEASQGLELAKSALAILDPLYASRSQIETATLQASIAQESVDEALRAYSINVRNLHTQAENAARVYADELKQLRNAQERYANEEQRYASGLISEFQRNRENLSKVQAEVEAAQAKHAYFIALLKLQDASFISITEELLRTAGKQPN